MGLSGRTSSSGRWGLLCCAQLIAVHSEGPQALWATPWKAGVYACAVRELAENGPLVPPAAEGSVTGFWRTCWGASG